MQAEINNNNTGGGVLEKGCSGTRGGAGGVSKSQSKQSYIEIMVCFICFAHEKWQEIDRAVTQQIHVTTISCCVGERWGIVVVVRGEFSVTRVDSLLSIIS